MRELKVAKSAGFCFGVSRSVKMAEQMLSEESSCFSFGELIHNADVVNNLEQKGLRVTNDPAVLRFGDSVIIRSHGTWMRRVTAGQYGEMKVVISGWSSIYML